MELLAPAGSIEALIIAVNCGADAVYLGLGEHNARIKASDFNEDNLSEWVDYCHLYGVKVYVTLNTSVKDNELMRIEELIKIIDKSMADAIIVTDIAVIMIAKKVAPKLNIHISTQAGVHNSLSAKFYKNLGAKRVVLARESADSDLADIKHCVDVDTECFVHGAICVSMSGACLMSSIIGGNSGNRGRCMQPCRMLYDAYDANGKLLKKGYLLSAADLADDIKPVDSLKIEGRLKRPEYVGVVTNYYKKLLRGKKPDINELKKIYNRGNFINKYNSCSKIIYPYSSSHIGIKIGHIISLTKQSGYYFAEIKSLHPIRAGDGLKILRDTVECGGSDVTSVKRKGDNYIVPVSAGVKVGDEVRLTTDSYQLDNIKKIVNKIIVKFKFSINPEQAILTAIYNDITAECKESNINVGSLEKGQIITQLSKTKDTPFEISDIDIANEDGYLPKSTLNAMRRKTLEDLRINIIKAYSREEAQVCDIKTYASKAYKKAVRFIEIQNVSQLNVIKADDVVIINPIDFSLASIKAFAKAAGDCYIKMPRLNREGEYGSILEYIKANNLGILADNVYAVQYARDNDIKYIAGIGLNIYNSYTFDYYGDAAHIIISPEVSSNKELLIKGGVLFALGYLPIMTIAHCPLSVVYDNNACRQKGKIIYYNNGEHSFAIVPTFSSNCQYTLYNGVIHNLLSKTEELGYNRYINMLGFDSLETLSRQKGTSGHFLKTIK